MKIILFLLLFLLLNNCSQEPKNSVIEKTYDFGRVKQGDTLKTLFQLRNDLDKNLKIEDVFASSSQVNVFVDKQTLKPKESATISVEFITDNLNGSQKRMISVKTDNETDAYFTYYITAVVQSLDSYKREDLFNLIKNKKETAHNLPKDFDFSNNYTEKELKALNLDPVKISANEYYFLSGQGFLKEDIEGLSFHVYHKHIYGNQVEKILRVQRPDTVFDILLAAQYSNGTDVSTLSTAFTDDFTFKVSKASVQTVKDEPHITAYTIDSLITFYNYDSRLNITENRNYELNFYKEIKENPETGKRDTLFEKNFSLGKIQTTAFYSGVSYTDYNKNLPGTITLYSKNNTTKNKLETIETWGAYISDMELFSMDKNHFIYISMSETSGNSYSYLYAIDTKNIVLNEVKQDYRNIQIPDTLQVFKGFGITKDANNKFTSGGTLRSENGRSYYFESEHTLTQENGNFVLKCIRTEITPTDH